MRCLRISVTYNNNNIIIMAGMAVFYVAGYLIEERRRWPVITADNVLNIFRILKERHVQMRKPNQSPGQD